MKLTQLVTAVGVVLALAGSAIAGTVIAPTPQTEETYAVDIITGELSVGYDSTYIFRGRSFGEDAAWSRIDLSAPLLDTISISGGAFYVNATDSDFDFDKLTLHASLGAPVGPFDVSVGYIANLFPGNSAGDNNEVKAGVSSAIGVLDIGAAAVYNFDSELYYFEGSVGTGFVLNDAIAAEIEVEVGFNEDSYSHTVARLSLPVRLNDTVTFTPYGAGIFRDEASFSDESEQEFVAGASLGVTF